MKCNLFHFILKNEMKQVTFIFHFKWVVWFKKFCTFFFLKRCTKMLTKRDVTSQLMNLYLSKGTIKDETVMVNDILTTVFCLYSLLVLLHLILLNFHFSDHSSKPFRSGPKLTIICFSSFPVPYQVAHHLLVICFIISWSASDDIVSVLPRTFHLRSLMNGCLF